MEGRVKRKLRVREQEERALREGKADAPACKLCLRPLGTLVEWHHPLPKSEGGQITVPVHPICHRTIHAYVSNHELLKGYSDFEVLRKREDIQRFLRWIASKPPDFNAPTRKSRV